MDASLSSLINLYVFTPGRRVYALGRLRDLLGADGPSELRQAIEEALAHEEQSDALQRAWSVARARRKAKAKPIHIDPQIDRKLALLDQILRHYATEDSEEGRYAAGLVASLFPAGVLYHTQLPHVEQLAANDHVLDMLQAPERQEWVDRLGLRMLVTSLHALNQAFREALRQRFQRPAIRYAELRAARARGQELLLEVVARILGMYPTPADAPMRARLLRPILEQNEAIRRHRKRRRRAGDIDPATGQDVEPAPGEDPSPAPPEDPGPEPGAPAPDPDPIGV